MARMPSKRFLNIVNPVDAETMLSRQHAAFVRLVKTLPRYDEDKDYHENQQYLGLFKDGRFIKLDDILAALQQGGKR